MARTPLALLAMDQVSEAAVTKKSKLSSHDCSRLSLATAAFFTFAIFVTSFPVSLTRSFFLQNYATRWEKKSLVRLASLFTVKRCWRMMMTMMMIIWSNLNATAKVNSRQTTLAVLVDRLLRRPVHSGHLASSKGSIHWVLHRLTAELDVFFSL